MPKKRNRQLDRLNLNGDIYIHAPFYLRRKMGTGFKAVWPPIFIWFLLILLSVIFFFVDNFILFMLSTIILIPISFDMFARANSYKRLYVLFSSHDKITVKMYNLMYSMSETWCSRSVLVEIGKDFGLDVKRWHKRLGYKWWYLLPKGTFTSNSPFFKLSFWKSVVGLS